MSKIKMSRADVFHCWPRVWSLGYCEMSEALRLLDGPRGYSCGVYGWNYDVYDVGGVAVCTGYRDMPGADVPRWFVQKWEKRARALCGRLSSTPYYDYKKYKQARARLARAFCKAFAALRVPRCEYVRGGSPMVPGWAGYAVRKRGGAWFYDDGRGVEGARRLVRPEVDKDRDGRPGWSFVLDFDGRHVRRCYSKRAEDRAKASGAPVCPVCASMSDRLKVCAAGAGCFYYLGRGNIGEAAGRPLCGCVGGRYESGAAARYVSDLSRCPLDKWRAASDDDGKGGR